jgi:FkbM family methyltransferase
MAISNTLKRFISRLPATWQKELKRKWYGREIKRGKFITDEHEFERLGEWVSAGDWVLDIGANIGQYTLKLSSLVGPKGRVLAFEPVPETFELLAANVAAGSCENVTLINAAASADSGIAKMTIPVFSSGMRNFYMAQLTGSDGELAVLTLAVDNLHLPHRVALIKIDAEGHEMPVLAGLRAIIGRDKPVLIVENSSDHIAKELEGRGYLCERIDDSSNLVFRHAEHRRD